MKALFSGPMTWDRGFLLVLALVAGGLLWSTPQLIEPYTGQQPWFESPALFPRLALALALIGGLGECLLRQKAVDPADSEELDSSAANMPLALAMLVLFGVYMVAVPALGYLSSSFLFLFVASRLLGMGWRTALLLALPVSVGLWGVFVQALKVSFGHGWLI